MQFGTDTVVASDCESKIRVGCTIRLRARCRMLCVDLGAQAERPQSSPPGRAGYGYETAHARGVSVTKSVDSRVLSQDVNTLFYAAPAGPAYARGKRRKIIFGGVTHSVFRPSNRAVVLKSQRGSAVPNPLLWLLPRKSPGAG